MIGRVLRESEYNTLKWSGQGGISHIDISSVLMGHGHNKYMDTLSSQKLTEVLPFICIVTHTSRD